MMVKIASPRAAAAALSAAAPTPGSGSQGSVAIHSARAAPQQSEPPPPNPLPLWYASGLGRRQQSGIADPALSLAPVPEEPAAAQALAPAVALPAPAVPEVPTSALQYRWPPLERALEAADRDACRRISARGAEVSPVTLGLRKEAAPSSPSGSPDSVRPRRRSGRAVTPTLENSQGDVAENDLRGWCDKLLDLWAAAVPGAARRLKEDDVYGLDEKKLRTSFHGGPLSQRCPSGLWWMRGNTGAPRPDWHSGLLPSVHAALARVLKQLRLALTVDDPQPRLNQSKSMRRWQTSANFIGRQQTAEAPVRSISKLSSLAKKQAPAAAQAPPSPSMLGRGLRSPAPVRSMPAAAALVDSSMRMLLRWQRALLALSLEPREIEQGVTAVALWTTELPPVGDAGAPRSWQLHTICGAAAEPSAPVALRLLAMPLLTRLNSFIAALAAESAAPLYRSVSVRVGACFDGVRPGATVSWRGLRHASDKHDDAVQWAHGSGTLLVLLGARAADVSFASPTGPPLWTGEHIIPGGAGFTVAARTPPALLSLHRCPCDVVVLRHVQTGQLDAAETAAAAFEAAAIATRGLTTSLVDFVDPSVCAAPATRGMPQMQQARGSDGGEPAALAVRAGAALPGAASPSGVPLLEALHAQLMQPGHGPVLMLHNAGHGQTSGTAALAAYACLSQQSSQGQPQALSLAQAAARQAARARRLFALLDRDGDGQLTREELQTAIAELGMQDREADIFAEAADRNEDGLVDMDEFVQLVADHQRPAAVAAANITLSPVWLPVASLGCDREQRDAGERAVFQLLRLPAAGGLEDAARRVPALILLDSLDETALDAHTIRSQRELFRRARTARQRHLEALAELNHRLLPEQLAASAEEAARWVRQFAAEVAVASWKELLEGQQEWVAQLVGTSEVAREALLRSAGDTVELGKLLRQGQIPRRGCRATPTPQPPPESGLLALRVVSCLSTGNSGLASPGSVAPSQGFPLPGAAGGGGTIADAAKLAVKSQQWAKELAREEFLRWGDGKFSEKLASALAEGQPAEVTTLEARAVLQQALRSSWAAELPAVGAAAAKRRAKYSRSGPEAVAELHGELEASRRSAACGPGSPDTDCAVERRRYEIAACFSDWGAPLEGLLVLDGEDAYTRAVSADLQQQKAAVELWLGSPPPCCFTELWGWRTEDGEPRWAEHRVVVSVRPEWMAAHELSPVDVVGESGVVWAAQLLSDDEVRRHIRKVVLSRGGRGPQAAAGDVREQAQDLVTQARVWRAVETLRNVRALPEPGQVVLGPPLLGPPDTRPPALLHQPYAASVAVSSALAQLGEVHNVLRRHGDGFTTTESGSILAVEPGLWEIYEAGLQRHLARAVGALRGRLPGGWDERVACEFAMRIAAVLHARGAMDGLTVGVLKRTELSQSWAEPFDFGALAREAAAREELEELEQQAWLIFGRRLQKGRRRSTHSFGSLVKQSDLATTPRELSETARQLANEIINAEGQAWRRLLAQRPLGRGGSGALRVLLETLPLRVRDWGDDSAPATWMPGCMKHFLVARAMVNLPRAAVRRMFKREVLSESQVLAFIADRARNWQKQLSIATSGADLHQGQAIPPGSWADRLLTAGSVDTQAALRSVQDGLVDPRALRLCSDSELARCIVAAMVRDAARELSNSSQLKRAWGEGAWAQARGGDPYSADRSAFARSHAAMIRGFNGLVQAGASEDYVTALRKAVEGAVQGLHLGQETHVISSDPSEVERLCGAMMADITAVAQRQLNLVHPDEEELRAGERFVVRRRQAVAQSNGVPQCGLPALCGRSCRVLWRGRGLPVPHELRACRVKETQLMTSTERTEEALQLEGWRRAPGRYAPGSWYQRELPSGLSLECNGSCPAEIALVGLSDGTTEWLPAAVVTPQQAAPGPHRESADTYWSSPSCMVDSAARRRDRLRDGALVGHRKAMHTTRLAVELLGGGTSQLEQYKRDWASAGCALGERDFIRVLSGRLGRVTRQVAGDDLKAQIAELFQEIDVDGDHQVDWEEFLDFLVELGRAPTHATTEGVSIETYDKVYIPRKGPANNAISQNLVKKLHYFEGWQKLVAVSTQCLKVFNPTGQTFEQMLPVSGGAVQAVQHVPCLNLGLQGGSGSLVMACGDITIRFLSTHDFRERVLRLASLEGDVSQTALHWAPCLGPQGTLLSGSRDGVVSLMPAEQLNIAGMNSRPLEVAGPATGGEVEIHFSRLPLLRPKLQRRITPRDGMTMSDAITCMSMLGSTRFCCATRDTTVRLWDAARFQEMRCLESHTSAVHSVGYNPDHQLLITAAGEKEPYCWDININVPPFPLRHDHRPHRAALVGVVCVPQTPQIITADESGMIKIWDIRTLTPVQTLTVEQSGQGEQNRRHAITTFCYVPDPEQRIVTCAPTFCAWEYARPGGRSCTVGAVVDAVYSGAQHTVITAGYKDLRVWDGSSGRLTCVYGEVASEITALTTDARGRKLLIGQHDGSLMVRSAATGLPIRDYQKTGSEVTTVCYVPCRRAVAVACADGSVRLFRDRNGSERPIEVRRAHSGEVICLVHNMTLQLVASADARRAIMLWDAKTFSCVGNIPVTPAMDGSAGEVSAVAFLGGRPCVAVASAQGAIELWTTRPFRRCYHILTWYNTPSCEAVPTVRRQSSVPTGPVQQKTALEVMREEFDQGRIDALALLNPQYDALFDSLEEERRGFWVPPARLASEPGLAARRLQQHQESAQRADGFPTGNDPGMQPTVSLPPLGRGPAHAPTPGSGRPRRSKYSGHMRRHGPATIANFGDVLNRIGGRGGCSPAGSASPGSRSPGSRSPGSSPGQSPSARAACLGIETPANARAFPLTQVDGMSHKGRSRHRDQGDTGEFSLATRLGDSACTHLLLPPSGAPPCEGGSEGSEAEQGAARNSVALLSSSEMRGAPAVTALVFDPRTEELISGDEGGMLAVWGLQAVYEEASLARQVWPRRRDDPELASTARGGPKARLKSVRQLRTWCATSPSPSAQPSALRMLRFSPALRCLIVCADGGPVLLWTPQGELLGIVGGAQGPLGEHRWRMPPPVAEPEASEGSQGDSPAVEQQRQLQRARRSIKLPTLPSSEGADEGARTNAAGAATAAAAFSAAAVRAGRALPMRKGSIAAGPRRSTAATRPAPRFEGETLPSIA